MRSIAVLGMLCLAACAAVPDRPARSSYQCMRAVRDSLPADSNDKRAHCTVSALIAQRCSLFEAYVAGIGKEVTDAFGGGDPEWTDWRADRVGIRCAEQNKDLAGIAACCDEQGY